LLYIFRFELTNYVWNIYEASNIFGVRVSNLHRSNGCCSIFGVRVSIFVKYAYLLLAFFSWL